MTSRSTPVRALQLTALLLGIATAVLFVAWLQLDPKPLAKPKLAAAAEPTAERERVTASRTAPVAVETTPPADIANPTRADGAIAANAFVFGTVMRADGTAPSGGYVFLTGMRSGHTVEGGTFAFAGIAPGKTELSTRFDDELPLRVDVDVKVPQTRVDLTLPARWVLTVNAVTLDDRPLAEALAAQKLAPFLDLGVAAFPGPIASPMFPTTSNRLQLGLGVARTFDRFMDTEKPRPKQAVGSITLPPDRPVHVALLLGGAILAQTEVPPGQPDLTFTIAPQDVAAKLATARMRILDDQGAPLVGAKVSLGSAGGWLSGGGTATDADGRVRLTNLQPGVLRLQVDGTPLRPRVGEVELRPGDDIDLGDIALFASTEVELVFDHADERRAVVVTCLEPPARTDVRPSKEFRGMGSPWKLNLTPGRHAIVERSSAGASALELDTRNLPPQPIRVELRPAATLRLLDRIEGGFARVAILTKSGAVAFATEVTGRGDRDLQLPPGTYDVIVRKLDGTTNRALELTAAGATLVID
jgi:hypothetical protein